MKELENEKLYEVDCKFGGLTPYNIENLTNDCCFMSLTNFADEVEKGHIVDYDGNGEFIYIDSHGKMYTTNESVRPSAIHKVISEAAKGEISFSCIDAAKAIREKYTDGEYKLFAIFWHNR